jgi:hypothetical protein
MHTTCECGRPLQLKTKSRPLLYNTQYVTNACCRKCYKHGMSSHTDNCTDRLLRVLKTVTTRDEITEEQYEAIRSIHKQAAD